jgi:cytochrome c-type protein NapB
MSRRFSLKSEPVFFRVGVILVVVVAMVSTVFIVFPGPDAHGTSFRAVATVKAPEAGQPILAEAGAFRDLRDGLLDVGEADASPHVVVSTRAYRSGRRAYDGAPPIIPHPLDPEAERTQDCAPCHTYGGYNPTLRTYSPRSPHPEMENCLQCHVRPTASDVFAASDWVTPEIPGYGAGGAVLGAPPAIPHPLQMREHCVSCHGGVSAAPDIRTDHPERFNCRQCHAAIEAPGDTFSRPSGGAGGS